MTGVVISVRGALVPGSDAVRHSFSIETLDASLPPGFDRDLPDLPNDAVYQALELMQSNPALATDVIMDAGTALMSRLQTHANGTSAMQTTLAAPAGNALRQIRIDIPSFLGEPHNLPWEVLFANNTFVDVESGVPILRNVLQNPRAISPPGKLTDGELRVVSVLAADGIDGIDEYIALRAALKTFSQPFRLRVFSPDASVQEAIAAEANPLIVWNMVPGLGDALMREIADFAPQLCHFFCHGQAPQQGTPSLEIGNAVSQMGGVPLSVTASQLETALRSSAWLVMLNACSSGHATGASGGLAARLVESGVPFAVGMRAPTAARTLHSFTRGFLSSALPRIEAALVGPGSQTLQLCESLTAGRRAICQSMALPGGTPPRQIKEWSLPVMCASDAPFELSPELKADPVELAKLMASRKTLVEFLDASRATLQAAQIAQIEQQITILDQKIQEAL